MASKKPNVEEEALETGEVEVLPTAPYRVLSGTVLGEPVSTGKPKTGDQRSAARLTPHKPYRKGSVVHLNEKDAKALLALKQIEPA